MDSCDKALDGSIAEREAQVEPDGVLDDTWRRAVAVIGDFNHRVSYPATSLGSPDKAQSPVSLA